MTWTTSGRADADIEQIYRSGLEQFGEAQADRYLDTLYDIFDLLSRHPDLARDRTEFTPPVRLYPAGSHLIVYRPESAGIRIVAIRHGREDWQKRVDR